MVRGDYRKRLFNHARDVILTSQTNVMNIDDDECQHLLKNVDRSCWNVVF